MVTPRGETARRRIVEAAWELSDARGAELVLGGVTLRQIVAAAGMSPSAVSYHFPTMHDLAVAMVDHLADTVSLLPVDLVDELLADVQADGSSATIRLAAQGNWDLLHTPEELTFYRRLGRCYAATGAGPGGAHVASVLAELNDSWLDQLAEIYRRAAERLGLRLVEPFDFVEVARTISAMTEGLLMRSMVGPAAVRHDLVADVAVALASVLLVPWSARVNLEEVSIPLTRPAPGWSPPGAADDLRTAASLGPMFVGGVDAVTLTEVANGLGCGPEEVVDRFGSLRRLAAMSFSRHLAAVEEAAQRRLAGGAAVSLTDAVYELSRCVLADPHCAIALHAERVDAGLRPAPPQPATDIRAQVPLAACLAPALGDLVETNRSQRDDLAELVVDTTLFYGATHLRTPPARIVEVALHHVPGLNRLPGV